MEWFDLCEKAALDLPVEKRQQILDAVNSGKTIGEIKEDMILNLEEICGVINMNINSVKYLRTSSK